MFKELVFSRQKVITSKPFYEVKSNQLQTFLCILLNFIPRKPEQQG